MIVIHYKILLLNFIPTGNNIVTDGWIGYNFLNNIGYTRYEHNHGRGDWGNGEESTSSETIWSVLKGGIIDTYKAIQNKDFMFFLKEQEFKYKNKKMTYDEIINEFLECYNLVKLIGVENIDDTVDTFLSNNYFTSVDNDNSSDSDN